MFSKEESIILYIEKWDENITNKSSASYSLNWSFQFYGLICIKEAIPLTSIVDKYVLYCIVL